MRNIKKDILKKIINKFDKVYFKIWNLLNKGLLNRNSSFHLPTFVCGENKIFDGRTVVLRGIDQKNKILWFHTDIRSKKIKIDPYLSTENHKINLSSLNVTLPKNSLPLDWQKSFSLKKVEFIETLLPLIAYQNQQILVERERLFKIQNFTRHPQRLTLKEDVAQDLF